MRPYTRAPISVTASDDMDAIASESVEDDMHDIWQSVDLALRRERGQYGPVIAIEHGTMTVVAVGTSPLGRWVESDPVTVGPESDGALLGRSHVLDRVESELRTAWYTASDAADAGERPCGECRTPTVLPPGCLEHVLCEGCRAVWWAERAARTAAEALREALREALPPQAGRSDYLAVSSREAALRRRGARAAEADASASLASYVTAARDRDAAEAAQELATREQAPRLTVNGT